MRGPRPIVVLTGAGLSAASGVPTFRGEGGLWEGHDATRLATPEAFAADPDLVRRFYDARRARCAAARPNAGHLALATLQRALGADRVLVVTQNVDGLHQRADTPEPLELHGSLWRLRCARREDHPTVPIDGPQDPAARCAACGAPLRPDVVWFGEVPRHLDRVGRALAQAARFVAVGTSGVVYPAAGFGEVAKRHGARTLEINPAPSGAWWVDEVIAEGSETALPRLVQAWIAEA